VQEKRKESFQPSAADCWMMASDKSQPAVEWNSIFIRLSAGMSCWRFVLPCLERRVIFPKLMSSGRYFYDRCSYSFHFSLSPSSSRFGHRLTPESVAPWTRGSHLCWHVLRSKDCRIRLRLRRWNPAAASWAARIHLLTGETNQMKS
jgi:hypothetical protein